MAPSSRRIFLSQTVAAGVAALVAPLASRRASAAAERLVVTDAGGEYQKAMIAAYYEPFKKKTGADLLYSARPSLSMAKLKAMVESKNVEWDVTTLVAYLTATAGREGLLEKLDYKRLDTSNMFKWSLLPYAVATDVYATVIAYSTKRWPAGQGPKSWADVWDVKKFPGRRSLIGIGYGPMEAALMADGVPMRQLYPLDVKRALKKMDEIRPDVSVWATTGAQQAQLMLDGEVDIIQGWNGRLQAAIDQGAPYVIEWNQGYYEADAWVIPKGAQNQDAAYKFLNFLMDPKQQAIFASQIPYGPTNSKTIGYLSEQRARILPTYPANLKLMVGIDDQWRDPKQLEPMASEIAELSPR